jgi:hypothetical protein
MYRASGMRRGFRPYIFGKYYPKKIIFENQKV